MRWFLTFLLLTSTGCVRAYATGALADAMAKSGTTYASDDDPELVRDAVPFALKTMEGVVQEKPEHRGLLLALSSGFVQYAFAFVDGEATRIAEDDIDRALVIRKRAGRLYRRALGYALQGLEAEHEGFSQELKQDPEQALQVLEIEDVPLLYWAAASWGLAIGTAKDDPKVLADFPVLFFMARRALALDETWNDGTLHELMVSLEGAFPGGSPERARDHFKRAVLLSEGRRAGPYVTLAENVSVKKQLAREFHQLLNQALAIDPDAYPEERLANIIMQRRAAFLKAHSEDFFVEDVSE